MDITIRKVAPEDFEALYELGTSFPELKVSATDDFMTPEDFRWAMGNPDGIFLLAENEGKLAGFLYANTRDIERTEAKAVASSTACLVYLATAPQFRRMGVASALYGEVEKELKNRGIRTFYAWANVEGDGGIATLLEKRGFAKGHKYMWMDKKLG